MKFKVNKVTVTEPTQNEDGTYLVDESNLDEIVRAYRKQINDARYRNLPNPRNQSLTLEVQVFSAQFIKQIIYITKGLIEAQLIETDKHGFLTGKVSSFGKWNHEINTNWIPLAIKALEEEELKRLEDDEQALAEAQESPLSEIEVAKLACEPTSEEDSKVSLKTKKGQRWNFDKINYTLTYKVKGKDKVINIIPEGTWRSTILKYLTKIMGWIKKKYNDFKDRCIGIKQAIQFKIIAMKFERDMKAEAKAKAKAKATSTTDTLPNTDALPNFN